MRQGQQNRRRGRNNNNSSNNANTNRKPQNPLSRTYELSGPDVKIRGTAAQIAEKYMTLARDASSSGDTVTAENYLQHAEHYNRIIMAAQAQAAVSAGYHGGEGGHGLNGSHRPPQEANGAMRDQPQPQVHPQSAPQPHVNPAAPQPYESQSAAEDGSEAAQPELIDGKSERTEPQSGKPDGKDEGAAGGDQNRRRRRRYPGSANGANRAAPSEENGGNGAAAEISGDGRPSDEALA